MKRIFRFFRRRDPHQNENSSNKPFFSKEKDQAEDKAKRPFFKSAKKVIQTKLKIGKPGDVYEKEADAVANAVVNNANNVQPKLETQEISPIQRTTLATPEEYEKLGTAEGKIEEDKVIQEQKDLQPKSMEEEEPVQMMGQEEEEPIQQMGQEEEEPVQTMGQEEEEPIQQMRQEEEEPVQTMGQEEEEPIQQMGQEEEEPVQTMGQEEEEPIQQMGQEEEEMVQQKAKSATNRPKPISQRLKDSKGKGSPMSPKVRVEMEKVFGVDFKEVRIHTGIEAQTMCQELKAQAFTNGKDIYFNEGKYKPNTPEGKRLLAHELTHILQQKGGQMQEKEEK